MANHYGIAVYGGPGNDSINAGAGDDNIWGEDGADTIAGSTGADQLIGGPGNDIIDGGAGSDIIFGGICHRFPKLKLVSVESGAGWLPSMLETFDWQWKNNWVRSEHPEYDLLPSEYFRRQIYGCFWFEQAGIEKMVELYPDNLMYETDFPHPTSMAVGPKSAAVHPSQYAERVLSKFPDSVLRKILHDTAAKVYHLN